MIDKYKKDLEGRDVLREYIRNAKLFLVCCLEPRYFQRMTDGLTVGFQQRGTSIKKSASWHICSLKGGGVQGEEAAALESTVGGLENDAGEKHEWRNVDR